MPISDLRKMGAHGPFLGTSSWTKNEILSEITDQCKMSLQRIKSQIQKEIRGLEVDQTHQETLSFDNTDPDAEVGNAELQEINRQLAILRRILSDISENDHDG